MRTQRGFTLVEVMIAVSIITILAALAWPEFARARDASQRGVCVDNQRVIFEASCIYEMTTNDSLIGGTDGGVLQTTLVGCGFMTRTSYFECPSSSDGDASDYALSYDGTHLEGVFCRVNPAEHLP